MTQTDLFVPRQIRTSGKAARANIKVNWFGSPFILQKEILKCDILFQVKCCSTFVSHKSNVGRRASLYIKKASPAEMCPDEIFGAQKYVLFSL